MGLIPFITTYDRQSAHAAGHVNHSEADVGVTARRRSAATCPGAKRIARSYREPRFPSLEAGGKGEPDAVATRVLATAVYVTGSTRLESGRRYGIAVHGQRLQILGPTEIDPSAIVLDRPLEEIKASTAGGRLIVSEPRRRSGLALAFMSVEGPRTDDLAAMILEAARETIRP